MNEMYEYLEEHAYISKNKKSNYQFGLTQERAECIANKHNSLCEEKDKEIERLNNIINKLENYFNKIKDTSTLEERMIAKYMLKYIKELKGSDKK